MADNSFDCEASSLLCTETSNLCFDDLDSGIPDDQAHRMDVQNLGTENDRSEPSIDLTLLSDESFGLMVERERGHLPGDDYLRRLRSGELDLSVRKEAIDWIWKAYGHYGFQPSTVCLSMNYFDRFLTVYELPRGKTWPVQLVALACLSIATKMEETTVPLTVDLQVGEPKFVFEGKTIARMELLVLSTLNWKMHACTSCSFLDYFLRKINDDHQLPPALIARSLQLILTTIKGIDFLEFKPSEIAAAVAISVSGEVQVIDTDKALSYFQHVEKGRVVKCLQLIQDLTSVNGGWSAKVARSNASTPSIPESPMGVLDAACLSCRSDELAVRSCATNSSHNIPDLKKRKLDRSSSSSGQDSES
ncbi:hypothetical protein NMG60_11007440 [Bertholletia excelsa]